MSYSSSTTYAAGMWTDQYPALLEKNFVGIKRLWDEQHPLVTSVALPARKGKYNFQWRIQINPASMAPFAGEGARTHMSDAYWTLEKFVCAEVRDGFQVYEREVDFGLENIVKDRTEDIVSNVNLRQEWENLKAMVGSSTRLNSDQTTTRLGTGAATATWDTAAASSAPLTDLLTAIKTIFKTSGKKATHAFVPLNEYYYLHDHGDILDQLKYVDKSLLTNGMIEMLKGLQLVPVPGFYKSETNEASFDPDNQTYILQDKVIVAACPVGFCGIAEGDGGPSQPPTGCIVRAWDDLDARTRNVQAYKSFVPVVEDYGRIYVITNTDSEVSTAVPA